MNIRPSPDDLFPLLQQSASAIEGDAFAAAPAGRRFVRLLVETERLSGSELRTTMSVRVRLPLPRPIQREELLGALLALLRRYTEQESIFIDVADLGDAAEHKAALDLRVASGSSIASLIESIRLALTTANPPMVDASNRSNIAATLVFGRGANADEAKDIATAGNYDAHFVLTPMPDSIGLTLSYSAGLLHPAAVDQLVEGYGVLLTAMLSDPTQTVQQLPMLSPQAIRELTVAQDGGTASYPEFPVHFLFAALARKQPRALAASFQGQRLTYSDLDERSNQLAHHLMARDVGPNIPVAVCLRPSLDVLIAMLAIWKARGVYLPLDPTHPKALIGQMLDEARPRLVLTTSALTALTASYEQLHLDSDADALRPLPRSAPLIQPCLSDSAYILYTSGTTGKAKGVVATQANLVQYVHSAAQKYGFSVDDVFASIARYTFSISLFELVSPLCCGGSVRILDRDEALSPEHLCRALKEITVLHAGPSLLGNLFRYLRTAPSAPRSFPRMRHASSGGDMVPPAVTREMTRIFPNAELFVIYGCSEISCMGTSYPIDRKATPNRTLVGKPFPNVMLRVFDANRNVVPFDVVGEICFAGEGIVKGYLDRSELTATKFTEIEGRRFYQTGDMGRLHADGNLEILGRRDFQVKIRGMRIELAGIENIVQELGLAAQCAVVARTLGEGDVRLVAFVVKPRNERIATFRRALATELPDYMLPHHVVVLEAMPLTANGKLDRNRLATMPWKPQFESHEAMTPMTERERKIADVFAQVLGLREVGAEDSFFDLGGDSLLGTVALMEIERAIGIEIPHSILFESGTVRALASHHPNVDTDTPKPILLNAECSGAPLFLLSGVHIYRNLARHLDGWCTAYGVFAQHELHAPDRLGTFRSIENWAQDYIRIIRRQQPTGPYRFLGFSFAGIVAYEVAQQLRAAGEKIEFLMLVDAHLPEWSAGWKRRLGMIARLRKAPLREAVSFLWRRILKTLGSDRGETLVYHDDKELGLWEQQRGVASHNAVADYLPRMRPFSGKVLLITSGTRLRENPLHSPSCGWNHYISDLEVHRLNADHFQMMRDAPHVTKAVEIVTRHIRISEHL